MNFQTLQKNTPDYFETNNNSNSNDEALTKDVNSKADDDC